MRNPSKDAALYSLKLRRRMSGQGVSTRALGKLTDPDNPERGRRRVMRHLSGTTMPSAASQRTYAEALNAPELAPEDDEEESLNQRLMREVDAARTRLAFLEGRLR